MTTDGVTQIEESADPQRRPPLTLVSSLLATSLIGRLPQAMSALALVRIVLDRGGDYAGAGLLTATYVIASTAGAPLLSRIIDVTGRVRLVLLLSSVASAAGFVGIVFSAGENPMLAFAFTVVAGLATPPLEPALRGVWPRLASPGRELQRVFAADAAAQEVLFILGPLATAVLGALLGATGAVAAMAVLTVIGTVLFCLHAVTRQRTVTETEHRQGGSALGNRTVRILVVALAAAGLPIGVLTISATRITTLNGDDALAGWGLAINAFGALIGAVWIARVRTTPDPVRALPLFLLALAVLYTPTALLEVPFGLWLPLALIGGFALPPLLTQVFALVAQRVPDDVATEANAWVISAFNVGIGAGTLIAATVTDSSGTRGTVASILIASAAAAGGALFARVALRREPAPAHP